MRVLQAAVLAAAGCSTQIVAGDLPEDASVSGCDEASCSAVCSRCLDGGASCVELVFGACDERGTCDLRQPVCSFSAPGRQVPDVACLGRRCGDPCTPGCAADDDACADGRAPLHCDHGGVCSGAPITCTHPVTATPIE